MKEINLFFKRKSIKFRLKMGVFFSIYFELFSNKKKAFFHPQLIDNQLIVDGKMPLKNFRLATQSLIF
jgi:hypothetical protein